MIALGRLVAAIVLAVAFTVGSALDAEPYPTKPIRLIIGFAPGGSSDLIARSLQPHLERLLGQPIIIENKGGAGGMIGIDAVAKAAPDGYAIGLGAAGALAVNVSLQEKMPYDPLRDLVPVSFLAQIPFILIAPASYEAKSVREVIALAKARPDTVTLGHGGNGTAMHLAAQLFLQMADIKVALVPYRGSGPVANDVLAGHVPLGVVDIPSALSLIRDGRLKALAVSTRQRYPLLPDVPTFAEAGLADYESIGWFGIIAPAGTPPEIVGRLNAAITTALTDPEFRERALAVGAELAPGTPEEFGQFIRSEIDKWAKVVAASGARAK